MDRRIERDENEFDRTCGFFDATFAMALTLLITTLDVPEDEWGSWSALWDTMGFQLIAFAISFALVAVYWWGNHRFVASLARLSPRVIFISLVMLGFVALIPFTTEALGAHGDQAQEIATVLYAMNIAVVSFIPVPLHLAARRDDLFWEKPTTEEVRIRVVDLCLPPAVFILSIPVAILASDDAARWCWASLAVIGPVVGVRTKRRIDAARDRAATGSA